MSFKVGQIIYYELESGRMLRGAVTDVYKEWVSILWDGSPACRYSLNGDKYHLKRMAIQCTEI
jgi:hypothetical protein